MLSANWTVPYILSLSSIKIIPSVIPSTVTPPDADSGMSLNLNLSAGSGRVSCITNICTTFFLSPAANITEPETGFKSRDTSPVYVSFRMIFQLTLTDPNDPAVLTIVKEATESKSSFKWTWGLEMRSGDLRLIMPCGLSLALIMASALSGCWSTASPVGEDRCIWNEHSHMYDVGNQSTIATKTWKNKGLIYFWNHQQTLKVRSFYRIVFWNLIYLYNVMWTI